MNATTKAAAVLALLALLAGQAAAARMLRVDGGGQSFRVDPETKVSDDGKFKSGKYTPVPEGVAQDRFGMNGDADGTSAFNNARTFGQPKSGVTSRSSITPLDAEATANARNAGFHRAIVPSAQRTYATVESDPLSVNPNRKGELIQPRGRSAIDPVVQQAPNLASGSSNMATMNLGRSVTAQTFEGASAQASSDSFSLLKSGGASNSAVSNNIRTSIPSGGPLKPASRRGSFAATAQPVGSLALAGSANGRVVVAQADKAVSLAQTESYKTFAPQSKTNADKRFSDFPNRK